MQVRWLLPIVTAAISIGCKDQYSGNSGEIQKSISGNNEYVLIWEKPASEKSDSITVKLRWKVAGAVRKEFVVASYDKMAMPEFKLEYEKTGNQVKIVDAFGSKFEFKCE